jgi:hypothetical protein
VQPTDFGEYTSLNNVITCVVRGNSQNVKKVLIGCSAAFERVVKNPVIIYK